VINGLVDEINATVNLDTSDKEIAIVKNDDPNDEKDEWGLVTDSGKSDTVIDTAGKSKDKVFIYYMKSIFIGLNR